MAHKPSPLNARSHVERMAKLVAAHDRIAAAAAAKVRSSASSAGASGSGDASAKTP
jgi:hypothetical protein